MDNEQPAAPSTEASAPEVAERPLWDLSRDEQRILIITFVGSLAAIVAGACVIGGAIALVRALKPDISVGVLAVCTAWIIFIVAWSVKHRRRDRGRQGDLWIWAVVVLGCLWLLLLWIGMAAGIH